MEILKASQFGIIPDSEISKQLTELFKAAKEHKTEKIEFESGVYYIDSDKCEKHMMYITNTVGDSEFSDEEVPHLAAVALYLSDIDNLTINGNDAVFIIRGKLTNAAFENCKNITFKNLEFRHSSPDMHELTVIKKSAFSVEFEADADTKIDFKNDKPYFNGKDYCYPADKNSATARWIPRIRVNSLLRAERVKHPLSGTLKYAETDTGFKAYYLNTSRFMQGDSFYIYDVRRQYVGMFVNKCENITFKNVRQRFNYSLALVLQDSKNITVSGCAFSPENNSPRLLSSCADFIQVSMCRGKILVMNCTFKGAGDDCTNIHGIHFKIVDIKDDFLTVRFMHPQTHGFDPFHSGDTIAFIDPKTLIEKGKAEVISSTLISETDIKLRTASAYKASIGEVIENISACPDVNFENNTISRIVTRGLLLTTRGKVRICDNSFKNTAMSGVLISDDAESWFESGCCKDVLIENNRFEACGQPTILIKPENKIYSGAVHENIRIIGNDFGDSKLCLKASSTNNVVFKNNKHSNSNITSFDKCENIICE